MDEKTLILLIVSAVVSLVLFIVLWQMKIGEIKRDTLLHCLLGFLLLALPGFFGLAVSKAPQLAYLTCLLIFLLLGILHTWRMYSLYWARRVSGDPSRDSFFSEFVFTLFMTALGIIGFTIHLWIWASEFALAFSTALIFFPLPFLFLKAYDFAIQIQAPDYEKKAVWEDFSPSLGKDTEINVRFNVHAQLVDEKKFFSKMTGVYVEAAYEDILGNVFRYGIEEINREEPDIQIIDLNRNESKPFWWLFYIKFILWRPSTWNRKIRYLDAGRTVKENRLISGDIIVAKRILF
jgi:hypothetical protein